LLDFGPFPGYTNVVKGRAAPLKEAAARIKINRLLEAVACH
jgi:hypothetical protein